MNRRELKIRLTDALDQLADAQARLEWLMDQRPRKVDGSRDYIIKESDIWTTGVTERPDGTFTSVWVAVKRISNV